MPTNGELIFWCGALVVVVATFLVLSNCVHINGVDDLNAWQRNYSRLQNRR